MMLPPELADKSDLELQRLGAREKLRLFGQYVTPAWDWTPKHWEMIAKKLEAVERGDIKRLMIFSPPRHGKSEISTIHLPAWYLLRNPEKRVMVLSHSASLAQTFSRRTRAIIREHGPALFGVELSDESASVDQWSLKDRHGMYIGAGVGTGITGQGSSLTIIDDPVKSAEEANSPTYRQRVWEWWTSTVYTRSEPQGAVIITLTRWHPDDLAGRILSEMEAGGERWDVVNLPAIAESEDDQLGREIGKPLWPARYGIPELDRIRQAVGSYVWNALFQQRPQDVEGGAFKATWFKWYTKNQVSFREGESRWYFLDEPMPLWQGVDPAISEKESADDFADVTIGVTPTHKIVFLDPWHGHIPFTEQAPMVTRKYQEWKPERVGIETNAYQMALKQAVVRDALVPVKGLNHSGDKFTRLMGMTPYAENGQMYLRMATDDEPGFYDQTRLPGVKIHESMRKLYEQMVTYGPKAAHDDLLDATENAVSLARPKMAENEFYQV